MSEASETNKFVISKKSKTAMRGFRNCRTCQEPVKFADGSWVDADQGQVWLCGDCERKDRQSVGNTKTG